MKLSSPIIGSESLQLTLSSPYLILGFELSSTTGPTCKLEAPLLEVESCFSVAEQDSGKVECDLGEKDGAVICSSSDPVIFGATVAGGVEIMAGPLDTVGWIGAGRVKVDIDEFKDNESGFSISVSLVCL